jgi:serine phosphatase RsbU (regulator of sigma subunit)
MITEGGCGTTVDWGVASVALDGDPVSGDLHVVAEFEGGALIGAIDGLGHGQEAAVAARESANLLQAHAAESLELLVRQCHDALRKTRGAVMTLASFDRRGDCMTWLGVGNVDGVLVRADRLARHAVSTRGGVVGYKLPPLRVDSLSVEVGDTLILATDGVRGGFADDAEIFRDPRDLARSIVGRYGKGSDDALVLVARYRGRAS